MPRKSTPKPKKPKKSDNMKGEELVSHLMAGMEGKKEFRGRVMRLSAEQTLSRVTEFVGTQVMAVDRALGTPGIPVGRVTEIVGAEGTGKSTLADHILAETQASGGIGVLLDTEEARDLEYTRRVGVDVDQLIVLQARTLEEAFAMMEGFIGEVKGSGADPLVTMVVDSIGGTPSKAELEIRSYDRKNAPPADAAKLIKYELRRQIQWVAELRMAMVYVNHLYDVINAGYGEPTQRAYGGSGLRYFATQRIEVQGKGKFFDPRHGPDAWKTHKPLGQYCATNIWKNKVAVPHGRGRFALIYGVGCDNTVTMFDDLVLAGKIKQAGTWYTLECADGEELKWQGDWLRLRQKCIDEEGVYAKLAAAHASIWTQETVL